ncbi:formimidoylglutamate deiminase [soil metagenome]
MTAGKFRFSQALLPDGWHADKVITLDGNGTITAIEAASKDSTEIPVPGIAIPGMPNVHSHAHQRLMAGLAERAGPGADSFWTWRETMYGFALKLGPEDLEAVAAQLYVEMLKSGFTTVGEFQYLHHQPDGTPYGDRAELSLRCLAAADQAEIAITSLPVLYSCGGFGGQPSLSGQRRFINEPGDFLKIFETLERQSAGHPLRHLGIAPHSLRAVTKDRLEQVMAVIPANAPIHIHIAEQTKEVDDCLAWSGKRPVEWLLDEFEVSSRWCAIHATHMSESETTRLAKSGAVAGLCPTTEANLGDGIFPATAYKGAMSIGTDSHISVSPAEDLRQLEYSQRLRDRTRNALAGGPGQSTGRSLFDKALAGGAQAMAQKIGRIAVGYRADFVVLDPDHPSLIGRSGDQALDSWIFSGGAPCVRDVYVAGKQVVADRHHIDEERILNAFRATVARLTE